MSDLCRYAISKLQQMAIAVINPQPRNWDTLLTSFCLRLLLLLLSLRC